MTQRHTGSKGFTLVELAIALMVIGLLIGGVLKGQELVENARVTATVRQIKSYETAATIFRNTFGGLPGDIKNPSTRIPDCTTAPCNVSGDKNNRIGDTGPAEEMYNFWIHMAKANMISGVDTTNVSDIWPLTPFDGQMVVFYMNGGAAPWQVHRSNVLQISGPSGTLMNAKNTAQIDRKIDDGKPYTGDMEGLDNDPGSCVASSEYNEGGSNTACLIWISVFW